MADSKGGYQTLPGIKANADISASLYRAVKLSSTAWEVAAMTNANAERPIGILQNDPDAQGKGAEVATLGVCKAEYGGTVAVADKLACDNSGKLITDAEVSGGGTDLHHVALAIEAGVSGDIRPVYVFPAELIGTE